jgi:hypothetical protein
VSVGERLKPGACLFKINIEVNVSAFKKGIKKRREWKGLLPNYKKPSDLLD